MYLIPAKEHIHYWIQGQEPCLKKNNKKSPKQTTIADLNSYAI